MLLLLVPALSGEQARAQQHRCQFYRQNPASLTVSRGGVLDREVEMVFTNAGTSTWQRTGGVSNLNYIELRPVNSAGQLIEGPLYHSSWINRQRVGSYLHLQEGVAPGQRARFVFRVLVDGRTLSVGRHYFYFRPYHASGHYIPDWQATRIEVLVTDVAGSDPPEEPSPDPEPSPEPTPSPEPAPTIESVVVQRTVLSGSQGAGAHTENYDLVLHGAIALRMYQRLQLRGSSSGSPAVYEWSLSRNGIRKVIGIGQSLYTSDGDLAEGRQDLCLRVRNSSGQWSNYATFGLDVEFWPRLKLPVSGSWIRNGYNYNEGDHAGIRALYAQDWNDPVPGISDFGREITASLPGIVRVGSDRLGGHYVAVESTFTQARFRALYFHLSTVLVRDGQAVLQGQPLGLCGTSGSASTGPHLHYVLQRWQDGQWQSVLPEPVWTRSDQLSQTMPFGATADSDNRRLPAEVLALEESVTGSFHSDVFGWGHSMAWAPTVSRTPTVQSSREVTIPRSGLWRIYTHNPSGLTNSLEGAVFHNTTSRAPFEITAPGHPGIMTFQVNQAGGQKGALLKVADLEFSEGDRVFILQHNATAEENREVTFDQLVLVLIRPDDAGGNESGQPPSDGNGDNNTPVAPQQPEDGQSEPPSQPQQPGTDQAPEQAGNQAAPPAPSSSSGGGGCHLTANSSGSFSGAVITMIILLGLFLLRRRV